MSVISTPAPLLATPIGPVYRQSTVLNLMAGGISCAVCSALLNFNDVTKVRLQMQGEHGGVGRLGYMGMASNIVKIEGWRTLLLSGMTPSMIRELTYSSIRMGLYEPIRNWLAPDKNVSLGQKILAGLLSGAMGSAFVNPADLIKVRLQAESHIPGVPRRYRGTLHAFQEIVQHEGWSNGLYRGVAATIIRAALLTSAQMASYDHVKHLILKHDLMGEHVGLHLTAGFVAGLVACTAANPADVIKTRFMNDHKHAQGTWKYSSLWDCLVKTVRNEGPRSLMKGWLPSYYRLGPHFFLSLPLFEQLRRLFGLQPL